MNDKKLVALLEQSRIKCLEIDTHSTPATLYTLSKCNTARLKRSMQKAGIYRMEGVDGYEYYWHEEPIPITSISIDNKTWMVDDPIHWRGMQSLAAHSENNVLCVGLGLGLLQHALHALKKNFETIEINSDVCDLMQRFIPKHKIYNIDFFKFERTGRNFSDYDTIILDIWAGNREEIRYSDMIEAYMMVKTKAPKSKVYIWGVKDGEYNPAVERVTLDI